MTAMIAARYVHFVSLFFVFSTLFLEYQLLANEIDRRTLKKIYKIDGLYGLFAILAVLGGLSLWLWVGKPAEFYQQNGIVYIKLTLFIIVGLLSIIPTIFFARNRKGDDHDKVKIPPKIKRIVLIELLILLTIPVLASLMANGIAIF